MDTSRPNAGAPTLNTPEPPPAAVSLRELLAVVVFVGLADLLVWRGHGYTGYGVFFAAAAVCLRLGQSSGHARWGSRAVLLAALVIVSLRMAYLGSTLLFVVAIGLLLLLSMTGAGWPPFILEALPFAAGVLSTGLRQMGRCLHTIGVLYLGLSRFRLLAIGMPVIAGLAFGFLFVLANPDVLTIVSQRANEVVRIIRDFLSDASPTELLFVAAMTWLGAGLINPIVAEGLHFLDETQRSVITGNERSGQLLPAFRNTLLTLIVLFVVYLAFEVRTLWFRTFPPGFYYSGYAHEGAFWLTCALLLATGLLCLIFRGSVRTDASMQTLRRLAWIWSLENFALALCVYHRLGIYVGFNGMTRMRVVGFIGISLVVIGFASALWKIARDKSALWLFRRHLWTLAFGAWVYAILPVDCLVMRHNVRRILAGDLAPSVQITVHPLDADGYQALMPLLDVDHAIIRQGVTAMLAARQLRLGSLTTAFTAQDGSKRRHVANPDGGWLGWTGRQWAIAELRQALAEKSAIITPYIQDVNREKYISDFKAFAYQWY